MNKNHIDEKTSIPLGIAFGGFFFSMGLVVAGTFWVSRVDQRLARIEQNLGISSVASRNTIIPYANAGTK